MLTSARCLFHGPTTYIFAGSQSINIALPILPSTVPSNGIIVKVANLKLHEKFKTESEYDYDVALASLANELTFGGIKAIMIKR